MRKLSSKTKKGKAEQSGSESTATEEEKVAPVNDHDASENESASDEKPSSKKKNKRGKKNDTTKVNDDGASDDGNDKRKRRTGAGKSEESGEEPAEEQYEVEKVIDTRVHRGQTQYKIRWKGFGADSDTWEPEADLNCEDLIEEFKKSQSEGDDKKSGKNSKKRGGKDSTSEPKNKKKKQTEEEKEESGEDEEDGDEKVYEVERVVDVHFKKNGKREFLIRWKGFSSNDDTWEPEDHLSCPELIEKFMSKVEKDKAAKKRRK